MSAPGHHNRFKISALLLLLRRCFSSLRAAAPNALAISRKRAAKTASLKLSFNPFARGQKLKRLLARAVLSFAILCFGTIATISNTTDQRLLSIYNIHTKETLNVVYKRNGVYDKAALKKINYIMRDWRRNEPTQMDLRLINLMWELHTELGSRKPIHLISGYRSSRTNASLRRKGGGQARRSRHILGKAADLHFPDISAKQLRNSALVRERGGVGYYPTSALPFVHVDTGRVRHWPRLRRLELASLFPSGKSRHVPRDGKPITKRDHKLAMAKLNKWQKHLIRVARGEVKPNRAKRPTRVASLGPAFRRPALKQPTFRTTVTNNRNNNKATQNKVAAKTAPQGTYKYPSVVQFSQANSSAIAPPPPANWPTRTAQRPALTTPPPAPQTARASRPAPQARPTQRPNAQPKQQGARFQLASADPQLMTNDPMADLIRRNAGPDLRPELKPELRAQPRQRQPQQRLQRTASLAKQPISLEQNNPASPGVLPPARGPKIDYTPRQENFARAPEYDDEHPDELSYRPFPILPLMGAASVSENTELAKLSHPDQSDVIALMEDPHDMVFLRFRPGLQFAEMLWASEFQGKAVQNLISGEADAPSPHRTADRG